ncbi:Na+/H+ antiporter NhaC family protein [Ornithinibacillus gellani]|uniref:Na+/H+ antiporter NhaC family protein n=1 Tax=Ornithinibacillus gellani TaxID=2293253 RepID=UPI000F486F80|nr:Na+/H+ antiporter NhaC family protein [Ornithinibacillus gellani]TQS75998.1 Na+/H+ antiporter NhaC family protein [Ornithinibacillus gellani]
MEGTVLSVVPAIVMLVLVLTTRRILLSLGTGIVLGALLIHQFHFIDSMKEIWMVFADIFYVDGAINEGNLLLLGFLLLLGIMAALLQASGGSQAFGEWMIKRVKTRTGAQLMTGVLGVIIFIDDYFNSLAVGQIARPLTDRHRISRAKLAYYIDSTSAPVTVLSPISSWGAYIIGIIGSIFAANQITDIQPLEAFVKMIPLNLYAWAALLLVFMTAWFKLDVGPMRKHEQKAMNTGKLYDETKKITGDLSNTFEPHTQGKIYHLLLPIIVLVVVTVGAMIVTGVMERPQGETGILTIFANTDVNLSLFIGGFVSVALAVVLLLGQSKPRANLLTVFVEGVKTMLPAIYILILAWMIGSVIGTLQTGEYMAGLIGKLSIAPAMLPFLFFLVAAVMSLSTGTSWGTFGILLPIAAEVSVVTDMTMLLPTMAAVLSGSVFGDHCTPISDTTILSSTGAGVNHIDHVVTQLPYAFIAAFAAGLGYLVIGLMDVLFVGPILALIVLAILIPLVPMLYRNKTSNI